VAAIVAGLRSCQERELSVDKARSLLDAAGVTSLDLEVWPVPLYPELTEFAQIHQADLAKIGVKLEIKPSSLATWVDQVVGHKYQGFYVTATGQAQLFPSTLVASGAGFNPMGNNSGFSTDAYKQLVASLTSEPDASKRQQLYPRLNDLLLDEAFVWPLSSAPFRLVARANVRDLTFLLHDGMSFTNVWLDPTA
jgi:peptide/nickel transport system substrate-binding protein